MKNKHYRLGDLISIKHGFAFSGEYIQEDDNGVVLVTPGNFRIGGGFQENKCKFFSGDIPNAYILKAGDFIVTMTDLSKTIDTLGYSAFVPNTNRKYLHNQRIGLVSIISDECDRDYLYWLMRTHYYQKSIANTSTGATVHHTSPAKIYEFEFDAPDITEQRSIANVLSTYDDLIENNQKQIKLLEEAAQRLYKEWFVDLRFPGYENVQIVDGVPEGWKKTTIENKCTLKKTIVHPEETQTGTAYIGLEHIPRHDFCLSNWGDASEVSSNKYIYNQKDIIFGQIRPYFHKVGFAINDGVASTDSFIMKPDERCWGLFLLTVSSDAFVQFAYQTCKEGAKMPRADWRQMKEYPLLIPGASLLCRFETFVAEITDKIRTIVLQNRYLTEARDRLLPKLMSGEIEL